MTEIGSHIGVPEYCSTRRRAGLRRTATPNAADYIERAEEVLAAVYPVTRVERLLYAQVLATLAEASAIREQPLTP